MSNHYPLTEDGGIIKNVVYTGHPDAKKPVVGQEVTIKYVGKLHKEKINFDDGNFERKIILG